MALVTLDKRGRQAAASEPDRLYRELARKLLASLASGAYKVGDRLPAERELAADYAVSRPTVREAIIALEVQGLVEVRVGSGAYVRRLPGAGDIPGFNITAFELTEARLLFEGESAALAATQITDAEIAELEALVDEIADENRRAGGTEQADRAFHIAIARATRNTAVLNTVEELWRLRSTSPESALLHAKARTANVKPVVDEHTAVLDALRAHDPAAARAAMRAHLSAVLDSLLFATEERAIAEARQAAETKRARYAVTES
ncbi:FadR/GntR family transcriptional regulator [Polymorphobacter megasporae]|uniref:FadR/GntR family transcriptional regulator n=1 Tax=Glacieibacterium megasporae TaxID=2835787 RepID=UPI001C1DF5CC|nr:FadR/GntR family transcriptional regulator [Polymorphobacter megasporae]UAJ09035.1 FadR family transcriptional regulator [Polymorphobacter megasporae]